MTPETCQYCKNLSTMWRKPLLFALVLLEILSLCICYLVFCQSPPVLRDVWFSSAIGQSHGKNVKSSLFQLEQPSGPPKSPDGSCRGGKFNHGSCSPCLMKYAAQYISSAPAPAPASNPQGSLDLVSGATDTVCGLRIEDRSK